MVVIERCPKYNDEMVFCAVNKIFDNLGGIDKYVKKGMKVALKPNLIKKKKPEDAATTHPSVVKAVAEIVKQKGGIVTIIDSPGGFFTTSSLKNVYSICGIEKAAIESGAELNYNLKEVDIENPEGLYLKKLTVIQALADADIIINLPKLKTHGQMIYTGAIKNMFGAVPGEFKAEYHIRMPNYNEFANALIDIYLSVKPSINIMDAVVGMDGAGPTAGDPKPMGFIIGADNGFELDFIALKLVGADPFDIPVTNQAIKRGLCPSDIKNIRIVCDDFESFKVDGFRMPQLDTLQAIAYYDKGIMKLVVNKLKPAPVFLHEKCISCGECVKICPAGVIYMKNNKPEVNLKSCIRCFCCQELCPQKAVYIKRPWVLDLYVKKRKKRMDITNEC